MSSEKKRVENVLASGRLETFEKLTVCSIFGYLCMQFSNKTECEIGIELAIFNGYTRVGRSYWVKFTRPPLFYTETVILWVYGSFGGQICMHV